MTNKTILAMAVATATAGSAAAADLPRGPAPYYPPPSSIYNWTGPYAGLNVGYEWGKVTNSSIEPSGVAGGGQIGYNWQTGQFVFGGETDIQISGADDTFAPYKFSNPWFGTLRGRAGFAINNVLLFIDLVILPSVDLRLVRGSIALVALSLLIYGLVQESR